MSAHSVNRLRWAVHLAVLADIRRLALERIRKAVSKIRAQPFYK